ncbi:response regulator [Bradyrhizobium hereditatis]|uniref:response regulator n=1 Tax=Bradyrhizobium hereditatis TaxID=2821405 RepID=UPI00289D48E7|nr:response regulator [Bradyrhizobium hereditatis]
MVSVPEPAGALLRKRQPLGQFRASAGSPVTFQPELARNMDPASHDGMPSDVLIVEDDAIIALDFEDTILELGVKTVRTAGSVVRALELIAERAPDFALLDVGLASGNSFAVAERLHGLQIPFVFVTGYSSDIGLPSGLNGTQMLPKPCTRELLEATLRQRSPRSRV